MEAVLEVRGLVKHYGSLRVVDGLDFELREGKCFGLLGPNGAGKTTTIEILEGIHEPDHGEVRYRGQTIYGTGASDYRERIGIQFQATSLPDYLTVREVLFLFSRFYRRPADISKLVERCVIGDFLDQEANRLSGGQKQRLLLAMALVNDPDLIFLDEPTTGLDPQARRNFWDLIRNLKRERKTIFLTTHYMEEAQLLCDEIAIMDAGRILVRGAPDTLLREHFQGAWIRLAKEGMDPKILDPVALAGEIREQGDSFEIETRNLPQALIHLARSGETLSRLQVNSPTLEDLF